MADKIQKPTINKVCQNFNTVIKNIYCVTTRDLHIDPSKTHKLLSESKSHEIPLKYTEYMYVWAKSEKSTLLNRKVSTKEPASTARKLPFNRTNPNAIDTNITLSTGKSL